MTHVLAAALRLFCIAMGIAIALTPPAFAGSARARPSADLVVTAARIYTADASHSMAEALAVRHGRIVFVGSATEVRRLIGPRTRVEKLGGRLVLPGLIDSHLHPLGMIKVDSCDLANTPRSLRELSEFAQACLKSHPVAKDGWLSVHQWNSSDGNQPDDEFPNLRAALDRVSTRVAVQLIGSDGHHGAFNSTALAQAKNARGVVVGYSKASLAADFSYLQKVDFIRLSATSPAHNCATIVKL
jgi:predicted amidohydrolase YtcJ